MDSSSNINQDGAEKSGDDESTFSDEIEPKLKYSRLASDLPNILYKDAASCIAVTTKFVCVGTHWGVIYVLDHQGTNISSMELHAHTVAVNQISIDSKGDHIASCSDDGKVFVNGLYASEDNQSLVVGRCVKTVAIDPHYYKPGSGRRFITGDDRLVLHEKTFLSRVKSTVLSETGGEGEVQSLKWSGGGRFVAWATQLGVRIYDLAQRCSLGLVKWNRTANEKCHCNLCWKNETTLLVGWADTVRVYIVRKREPSELLLAKNLPDFMIQQVSMIQTEFIVSGICPLGEQLVVLGCLRGDEPQRPQLHVLEPKGDDYVDLSTDSLSLRGYQQYSCNDYHLECLIEEHRFVIVSPKDVVVASPYDADDRLDWLMDHSKFDLAMEAVVSDSKILSRHTMLSVGREYLDHLLFLQDYEEAGKLCQKILGKNKKHWEEEVFKFAKVHQLRAVSSYLPRGDTRLDPTIYEMVLYEYLKMDPEGLLTTIKEWSPTLYNVPAVINAVLDHLLRIEPSSKVIFLEALAVLYSHDGRYAKAIAMYLRLQHKGVFQLIRKHNLYSAIHDMIEELMDLDHEQAVALFLEKEKILSNVVVSKLQHRSLYLYYYLDALERRETAVASQKNHGLLVPLYADFAREKLLPLLRRSDQYPIQDALNLCKIRCFYPEMVYLLGRIGNTREALHLITEEIGDIESAVNFCKEHDDHDLWQDLINYSLNRADYISFLLQKIGTYIDPREVVQQIAYGLQIPGLKNSLVKMMHDYNLQVSVQEGCKKILVSDYFHLHEKLVCTQQRAALIDDEQFCGACHHKIIMKDPSQASDILIFYCHHAFHVGCLPGLTNKKNCIICTPR